MRRRGLLAGAAMIAVGALALSGCTGSNEQQVDDKTQVSVLLDWTPNPDHLALYTAQHIGAYDDAGLAVDLQTPGNTADAAKQVSLGQVDLAVSYEPDTLIAAGEGLDVVSVAALVPTALTSLTYRDDSGISGVADLAGKQLGISGLASQQPTIDYIARQAGIDPSSIETVNLQQGINQALIAGTVPATFGAFVNIDGVELADSGNFTSVPVTELGVPDYDELVIIAQKSRLESDPDYAQRVRDFLSATAKGQQAAREDASQAVAGLAEVTEGVYSEDLLARMIDATLAAVPEDWSFGQQSPEQWQTYATWMRENDLLSTDVDGATAVTTEYVPSAG